MGTYAQVGCVVGATTAGTMVVYGIVASGGTVSIYGAPIGIEFIGKGCIAGATVGVGIENLIHMIDPSTIESM